MTFLENDNIITLHPGELYFGHEAKKIKTLLGSCVALTVWHAKYHVGGMCHYLMAQEKPNKNKDIQLDKNAINPYRYGSFALDCLYHNMSQYMPVNEFEIRLFGGSNMYAHTSSPTIGEKNISFAQQWLRTHNLIVNEEDILGNVCRTLLFDLVNGSVKLQRYQQEEN